MMIGDSPDIFTSTGSDLVPRTRCPERSGRVDYFRAPIAGNYSPVSIFETRSLGTFFAPCSGLHGDLGSAKLELFSGVARFVCSADDSISDTALHLS